MEFKGGFRWNMLWGGERKPKKTREERLLDWALHHHWAKGVTLVHIQNTIFGEQHALCQGLHPDVIAGVAKQVFDRVKAKRAGKSE